MPPLVRPPMSAALARIAATSLALLTLGLPAAAQDASRPGVAVLDFTNSAIGAAHEELAPLAGGLSDLLAAELAANPRIRLVERKQVRRLLDEQALVAGQQVDVRTAIRVGRLLGVQGDQPQAVELYTRSLSHFPAYAPARRALDRMGADAGR